MDIPNRIEEGVYESKIERLCRPAKRCIKCATTFTSTPNFCVECGSEVKADYTQAMQEYNNNRSLIREDEVELYSLFFNDCMEDLGLTKYPAKSKMFDYAWSVSHSDGRYAVYNTLEELADFIVFDEVKPLTN